MSISLFKFLLLTPLLLAIAYAIWQWRNHRRWQRVRRAQPEVSKKPSIAIIIPFRNEAANLPGLLESLRQLDYPAELLEVVLIDDHSEDGGAGAVAGAMSPLPGPEARVPRGGRLKEQGSPTNVRLLFLKDHLNGRQVIAHKKEALAYGIASTTAEIVFTTDADCQLPPSLLQDLAAAFRPEVGAVLGPVLIAPANDFLSGFQALDLAAYQLYTAACVAGGSPTLANGACFAFRRKLFLDAGGYAGVDHLPSGDDVLLLHKFNAHGTRSAWKPGLDFVKTKPVTSWTGLWNQRLRWAGKAGEYVSPELKFGQALTWLLCAAIALSIPLGLFSAWILVSGLLAWLLKGIVDWVLLRSFCHHYQQQRLLGWYLPTMLLYPFYLFAIGTAALLGLKAGWKGR